MSCVVACGSPSTQGGVGGVGEESGCGSATAEDVREWRAPARFVLSWGVAAASLVASENCAVLGLEVAGLTLPDYSFDLGPVESWRDAARRGAVLHISGDGAEVLHEYTNEGYLFSSVLAGLDGGPIAWPEDDGDFGLLWSDTTGEVVGKVSTPGMAAVALSMGEDGAVASGATLANQVPPESNAVVGVYEPTGKVRWERQLPSLGGEVYPARERANDTPARRVSAVEFPSSSSVYALAYAAYSIRAERPGTSGGTGELLEFLEFDEDGDRVWGELLVSSSDPVRGLGMGIQADGSVLVVGRVGSGSGSESTDEWALTLWSVDIEERRVREVGVLAQVEGVDISAVYVDGKTTLVALQGNGRPSVTLGDGSDVPLEHGHAVLLRLSDDGAVLNTYRRSTAAQTRIGSISVASKGSVFIAGAEGTAEFWRDGTGHVFVRRLDW